MAASGRYQGNFAERHVPSLAITVAFDGMRSLCRRSQMCFSCVRNLSQKELSGKKPYWALSVRGLAWRRGSAWETASQLRLHGRGGTFLGNGTNVTGWQSTGDSESWRLSGHASAPCARPPGNNDYPQFKGNAFHLFLTYVHVYTYR